MDAEIIRKNGETYSFEDYGVLVKDFIVSSIPVESTFGEMEGRDGRIDKGARSGNREIRIPFSMKAYDLLDFPLLRDVLFELVTTKESFYLREKRRPKKLAYKFVDTTESPQMDESTNNQYIGGKRYLVRLQNSIEIEQVGLHGDEELIFETTELPYAESIGTSQNIQENGIDANDELWGFGMGLIADDDSLIYTHTGKSFRIYNPGNVKVHPFQQELKITISDVQGSSGGENLIDSSVIHEGMYAAGYNSGTGEIVNSPDEDYFLSVIDVPNDGVLKVYKSDLEKGQFLVFIDGEGNGIGLIRYDSTSNTSFLTRYGDYVEINVNNLKSVYPSISSIQFEFLTVDENTAYIYNLRDYFQLINKTNGNAFRINDQINPNQTVVLDGANVTSNSLAFLRSTNRKFIQLEPGWNEFEITGADSATVEFDFRFYYY